MNAPLSPERVTQLLDVGTGWGAWVTEVAEEFPSATVIGLDISPVTRTDVPPNCRFVTADLTKGLPFEDGTFDFVHSRYLLRFPFAVPFAGLMGWVGLLWRVFRELNGLFL